MTAKFSSKTFISGKTGERKSRFCGKAEPVKTETNIVMACISLWLWSSMPLIGFKIFETVEARSWQLGNETPSSVNRLKTVLSLINGQPHVLKILAYDRQRMGRTQPWLALRALEWTYPNMWNSLCSLFLTTQTSPRTCTWWPNQGAAYFIISAKSVPHGQLIRLRWQWAQYHLAWILRNAKHVARRYDWFFTVF